MVAPGGTGLAILQLISCAARIPITIVSWLIETKRPLTSAGVISAIYIGERFEARPIPTPPRILNITKILNEPAAPVPKEAATNNPAEKINNFFRPSLSLSQPEITEPARHPASAQPIAHPCKKA